MSCLSLLGPCFHLILHSKEMSGPNTEDNQREGQDTLFQIF